MPKLAATDESVLSHVAESRGSVMRDAYYWNGVRRAAANRLVKRGMLTMTRHANGEAYEITDAGRAALGAS